MDKGNAPELRYLGRGTAQSLLNDTDSEAPELLFFSTPDFKKLLPVWVAPERDLGGHPTDLEILVSILGSDKHANPWFAELSTVARGQFTATLSQALPGSGGPTDDEAHIQEAFGEPGQGAQGARRHVDVRPVTIAALWEAGLIFDLRLAPRIADRLLDVNEAFLREFAELLNRHHVKSNEPLPLAWTLSDLGIAADPDPEKGFQELWEGLGLSTELDDWLMDPEEGEQAGD